MNLLNGIMDIYRKVSALHTQNSSSVFTVKSTTHIPVTCYNFAETVVNCNKTFICNDFVLYFTNNQLIG